MRYDNANIGDVYKKHPKIKSVIHKNLEKVTSVKEETGEEILVENKVTKGIFLIGATGRGKTYTLHAIRKNLPREKVTEVENWVELLFELKDKINKGFLKETVYELCRKQYFFIDDLGAEKQTEWSQEILYLIVNRLYEDNKSLFVATNLSLKEFTEKYGDRIADRLGEMCEVVELKGDNLRD